MSEICIYTKPNLEYWSAEKLNSIEATMSGGGGSGTGFGYTYEWDKSPRVSTTSLFDLLTFLTETAISAIVAVATRNASLSVKIKGRIAGEVAKAIVSLGVDKVYCRSTEYYYKAVPRNPAGVPMVCGNAVMTEFFSDSGLTQSISEPTYYSNVSGSSLVGCPIG